MCALATRWWQKIATKGTKNAVVARNSTDARSRTLLIGGLVDRCDSTCRRSETGRFITALATISSARINRILVRCVRWLQLNVIELQDALDMRLINGEEKSSTYLLLYLLKPLLIHIYAINIYCSFIFNLGI